MNADSVETPRRPVRGVMLGRAGHELWHVPAATRLRRLFGQIGLGDDAIVHVVEAGQATGLTDGVAVDDVVLLARVDTLFEPRALAGLARRPKPSLLLDSDGTAVAALAPAGRVNDAARVLFNADGPAAGGIGGFDTISAADLDAHDERLRRSAPPLVARVGEGVDHELEARLYGNAYKGVTDAVTKWLWPRPSAWLVRRCARWKVTPNQVTLIGFVLVLVAGWLFARGDYAAGLAAAWVMTLLDTVDGKLARVTVQSSRFGDRFDHGIDLVHPPFWYLAWGLGLEGGGLAGVSTAELAAWIFIPYTLGRLTEGGFTLCCGSSMFTWRPFDSWFRLITARRNPALVLLTMAVLLGQPAPGLWVVIGWAVISTLVQFARLGQAVIRRLREQRPESWLAQPDAEAHHPLSYRTFAATRGAFRR